ncbi:MAG: signal peptide peptidase SppA, type [Caulobacter sp.]|nr:signal peptide peptidase SppA, type [Caulobacter sp.]
MKQFLLTVAGVFVGLMLFFVVVPFIFIIAIASSAAAKSDIPSKVVLQLDLRTKLTDQSSGNPFAAFRGSTDSVMGIVTTLREAETDRRVKGVFVRLPEGGMPPAAADELRLAFKHFRASGKPIWAHSQGLYASGAVICSYMLGASADQLWMQPDSSFQAVGMASEDVFLKRFFDKHAIKAEYEQRYEYKNAVNPYLYSDYTPAHRESELSWMGSIYGSAVNTAAADRKKDPAGFLKVIEAGPYSAEEALAKGLIDKVGQVREAQNAELALVGGGAKLLDFDDYSGQARRSERTANLGRPTIAVINAEGAIITGSGGGGSPFSGDSSIYSDQISKAIYDAIDDKDVKAIVFRVSSPGGSDTASEQILSAVRAAKAAGKPVVVSMGVYAASGGYWISSQASYIVAEPTTLTGSIGVFGGKFAMGDALGHFGIDLREQHVGGDYATAFGGADAFDPSQRAAFAAWMDRIYAGFISRVAEGRHLSPDRVREIAKGRVWTGVQAKQLGLVDQIGGFYDAVDKAKSLAGITGQARLKTIGGSKSPFAAFQRLMGGSEASLRTVAAAAWIFGDPRSQAILDQMADAKLRTQHGATVLAPSPMR